MRNLFLLILFCGLFSLKTEAQNIQINADTTILSMMNRFAEINKSKSNLEGWRIQITATTDRQKLEGMKQTFQYRYPNISVDWVHSKPYFKLLAGAFATKLEALRLKYILEKDYPGIFLVKDRSIRPEELVGY